MVRLHATAATAPAPCSQYCQTVIKITRVCIEPWIGGVVHTILLYAIPHLFKRKSEKKQGYQDRQNARQSTGDEIYLNQV